MSQILFSLGEANWSAPSFTKRRSDEMITRSEFVTGVVVFALGIFVLVFGDSVSKVSSLLVLPMLLSLRRLMEEWTWK